MRTVEYVAAGGVVLAGGRVLVLHRPSRGEVRLPKGRLKKGESVEQAAQRQVAEESGFVGTRIAADLGEQLVEYDHRDADGALIRIARTERFFAMELTSPDRAERPAEDEEEYIPDWLEPDEATLRLTYDSEREWVARALRGSAPE